MLFILATDCAPTYTYKYTNGVNTNTTNISTGCIFVIVEKDI